MVTGREAVGGKTSKIVPHPTTNGTFGSWQEFLAMSGSPVGSAASPAGPVLFSGNWCRLQPLLDFHLWFSGPAAKDP